MTKTRTLLALALSLGLTAASASAQVGVSVAAAGSQPARQVVFGNTGMGNQYDTMVKALQLTDDQKTKLKAVYDAFDADMKDFQAQTQDLWKTMGPDTTPEARKKAMDQFMQINKDRQDAMNDTQAQVDKILTPEQRADWEAYQLVQSMIMRLKWTTTLTAEEQTKLEKLCKDSAKEVVQAKNAKDQALQNSLMGKLWKAVFTEVLTDEQIGQAMGGGMQYGVGGGAWNVAPRGGATGTTTINSGTITITGENPKRAK